MLGPSYRYASEVDFSYSEWYCRTYFMLMGKEGDILVIKATHYSPACIKGVFYLRELNMKNRKSGIDHSRPDPYTLAFEPWRLTHHMVTHWEPPGTLPQIDTTDGAGDLYPF